MPGRSCPTTPGATSSSSPPRVPSPDYYGGERIGSNRYANSVVALHARSGAVAWSFQTVHHDLWDYDIPAQPVLATVMHDGSPRDVVVQATKTGFLFVLDRDSGEPVFPVEERPVPADRRPGRTDLADPAVPDEAGRARAPDACDPRTRGVSRRGIAASAAT